MCFWFFYKILTKRDLTKTPYQNHYFIPLEYGNIGYHSTRNQSVPLDSTVQLDGYDGAAGARSKTKDMMNKKGDHMKPVVPIISIDLPD